MEDENLDMNIIDNNPYRLLGVYANSPTKERVANEGKLKAFLKVNRQVAFPLDLTQYLPSIKRTIDTPANAEARLTLPADQIKYAQFWFLNVTPVDKIAFRHLTGGDMDNAIATWDKATNVSSIQNRIVCYLIRKDYSSACKLAEVLYKQFASQFVSCVVGDNVKVPSSLAFDFLDMLSDEIGTSTVLGSVSNAEWKKHISAKAVSPVIAKVQTAVDTAKSTRGKGAQARYNAGVKLMNSTKSDLAQLKTLLPTTDLQYQMIADKLGLEILQCGIDYYNDSDEPDAARKAMVLQNYSLTVVVGKMAKDRCQENVNILKEIIASLPPKDVAEDADTIHNLLNEFSEKHKEKDAAITYNPISDAIDLMNKCAVSLVNIRERLGKRNPFYIRISTEIAAIVQNTTIEEINTKVREFNFLFEPKRFRPVTLEDIKIARFSLSYAFREAWEVMLNIGVLDIDEQFWHSYEENKNALESLGRNLEPKLPSYLDGGFMKEPSWLRASPSLDLRTEEEIWNNCKDYYDYEKYMKRYPKGHHYSEAKERHDQLVREKKDKENQERISEILHTLLYWTIGISSFAAIIGVVYYVWDILGVFIAFVAVTVICGIIWMAASDTSPNADLEDNKIGCIFLIAALASGGVAYAIYKYLM